MPWPLPESEAELLALALGYPYEAPPGSYHLKDGALLSIDQADFANRVPVIGHGSNRAPAQLTRKFSGRDGPWEIPVTFGWLQDYDVVYSAHITQYGAIASTLTHCPGAKAWVAINWLDEAQLMRMHETEGRNYPYGKLADIAVELEPGAGGQIGPVIEEPHVYHSRHGALSLGEAPIGLEAAPAEGRPHFTMSQREVQELVHGRHGHDLSFEAHVLLSIADPARRAALVEEMQAHAQPAESPHFVELDPLEEWA